MTDIILPNGEVVDNYSSNYRLYCEAKWLLTKDINFRREWLFKIGEKRKTELEPLKKYLDLVFSIKNIKNKQSNSIIMP
jgi:hypothetical protein